jgi:Patatin-like phospholipase
MSLGFVLFRRACVVLIVIAAAGCSNLPRTAFTVKQQTIAQVPGMPGVRIWADAAAEDFANVFHIAEMQAAARKSGSLDILAISGGASDGAFGAGALTGLTALGRRPEFTFVSGVSAGALIAPLAFLGPRYDDKLAHAWTSGIAEPLGEGGVLSILFSQDQRRMALYDLVSSFVDEEMLQEIAAEHRRGRRLVVVTTNLDAQRPVLWDLGAIAASGHPNALRLFRDVLTASSSVPGAFAPTLIDVEADGRQFAELHVDGGATTQLFTIPEAILARGLVKERPAGAMPARFFIIVNNRLKPEFEVVQGSTVPVLARSFSSLIKTHARLTLVATREFARTRNMDFNLAYISDDFSSDRKPSFETAYMRSVYRYGYDKALSGNLWQKQIPFLSAPAMVAARALR